MVSIQENQRATVAVSFILRRTRTRSSRTSTCASPISAEKIIATLKELGADGVDQHFKPEVVTADYIAAIRSAGFEYHSWTIDDLPKARLAFSRGAQTVTTNCAKKLLDEYRAVSSGL